MKLKFLLTVFIFSIFLIPGFSQLNLPQASPKGTVSQTIGLTDITVVYHTPGVKSREIWGKLVPYDQVWRSGANEATLVTFSDDVKINGKPLAAGTYSVFTLPEKDKDWFVIFNKNTKLWGTEGYSAAEDALRVPVKPYANTFQETLQFVFSNIGPTSGTLNIAWEKLIIPFTIQVQVFDKALANIKNDLSKAQPQDWSVYAQAAQYLIQNNAEHELALEWINKSLGIKENFLNNWLKAQLLAQKDEYEEAVKLSKKALKLGEKDTKNFSAVAPEINRSLNEWKVKMHNN